MHDAFDIAKASAEPTQNCLPSGIYKVTEQDERVEKKNKKNVKVAFS